MTSPVISIDSLNHTYPDGRTGLAGINLTIMKGEFVILAGRNGSGKTTLLKHLNALIPSDRVRICQKSASRHPREATRRVGMVFQDADIQIVSDTVYDDVAFGLENLKVPRKEIHARVVNQLAESGISHLKDRHPSTLSGGEKRKLALAGIMVMKPEILVFDEPFSNLDFPATGMLVSLIETLCAAGHTIVIATHDIEPVMTMADRLIIMENGKIMADGAVHSLLNQLELHGIKNPCAVTTCRKTEP